MSINEHDIDIITNIAKAAGEMINRRRLELTSNDIASKSTEKDIVTIADKECEEFLRRNLKENFPDIAFYGEEGTYGNLQDYSRVFVVDPIDGTASYLHGYPFYCVSIGLREAGVATAGVVYLPYIHDVYTALKGQGALKNGKRVHVSAVDRFVDAIGACGFACVRGNLKPDTVELAGQMIRQLQGFRRSGSAAIDLCHIAEGCLDLYWEFLLKPWDYAAGTLIAQEAGAIVTGFDGNPIDDNIGQVLATNGRLHESMLHIINDYLASRM